MAMSERETSNAVAVPATALVLNGTTYDLVAEPSPTSQAVIAARAEVLQNLDLGTLLTDLDRTNDLLYVAACGVSGNRKDATLSAKVQRLQYGLEASCSSAALAMTKFGDAAGAVLTTLRGAFRFLYTSPPREDRTIQMLTRCEAQATSMAETAGSLATNFKTLADDAEGVCESTLTARDMEEQERLAAIDHKREVNAKSERAKALKEALAEQMVKVQKLIDEAREAQNKSEDRAFGLAIAGNISSALGSAVQGFMSVKAAPMMMASNLAGAMSPGIAGYPGGAMGPGPGAAPGYGPGPATAPGYGPGPAVGPGPGPAVRPGPGPAVGPGPGPAVGPGPGPAVGPGPGPAVGPGPGPAVGPGPGPAMGPGPGPAVGPGPRPAVGPGPGPTVGPGSGPAASPVAANMGRTSAIAGSETAVGAAFAAAGAKATEGNVAMASSYGDIAERYAEEKRKWLDLLMDLQKEQRNALGDIAQYAEEMRKADLDTEAARSAVESLQQAVAALKQIVTILETAKFFWEMMAQKCKQLAEPRIRQDIEMFKDDPPEERLAEYARDEFKSSLLQLAWRWCALKVIADDYRTAVTNLRAKVVETARKAPTIEEAKRLAPALGAQLALDIQRDMQAIEARTAELQAEQAQLPPSQRVAA
jgi:hypothetical protein